LIYSKPSFEEATLHLFISYVWF